MTKKQQSSQKRGSQEQATPSALTSWVTELTTTLQMPVSSIRTRQLTKKAQAELTSSFKRAKKRTILLDYDGTLVSYTNDPMSSKPPASLIKALTQLARVSNTTVAVVSNRTKTNLTNWLGQVPITLVAEHSAMIRRPKQRWQKLAKKSDTWAQEVLPYLERFAADTPRSFVEAKDFGLSWHYRASPPYQAQKNLVILKQALRPIVSKYGLKIHAGNKTIDIKSPNLNKGLIVQDHLTERPGFVLIIGDDYSGEDMFKAASAKAFTVKVGRGITAAKYRLPHPVEAVKLLTKLADI